VTIFVPLERPVWPTTISILDGIRGFAALSNFMVHYAGGANAFVALQGVLPYFVYLQNVPTIYPAFAKFPDAQSLSQFWSLAVEEQFYLIWVLFWPGIPQG
jgi:peptidoglycan/LPS O-acetylase OafA/YrhL